MRILLLTIGRLCFWAGFPVIWLARNYTRRARVLVVSQGEFLLVRSWIGSGKWELPGGGLHRRESYRIGVSRELFEEVGIVVKPEKLLIDDSSKKSSLLHGVYLAEKPKINLRVLEIRDYKWIKFDDCNTIDYSSYINYSLDWWQQIERYAIIDYDNISLGSS